MDLTHHFLLSMPTLANSWFDKSITYIFEHSDSGAIGFVINRQTHLVCGDIYNQLDIDCTDKARRSAPVFQGGPVDGERGFILCASDTVPDTHRAMIQTRAMQITQMMPRYLILIAIVQTRMVSALAVHWSICPIWGKARVRHHICFYSATLAGLPDNSNRKWPTTHG